MGSFPKTLPYPLSDLYCSNCKKVRVDKADSTTTYSRTMMKVDTGFGRKTYYVEVEVLNVERSYDKTTSTYSVCGTFRVLCPKCKEEHIRTHDLFSIPMQLLHELATCQNCWQPCEIEDSSHTLQ